MKYKLIVSYTYRVVGESDLTNGTLDIIAEDEEQALLFMGEFFESLNSQGKAIVSHSTEGFYFHN